MLTLGRYSIGIGDRFGLAAEAQLRAVIKAREAGIELRPVWNKSNREHNLIGTQPGDVRAAAAQAVSALGWKAPWFADADHVSLKTVDRFLDSSNFFTIDVADCIGRGGSPADERAFVAHARRLIGESVANANFFGEKHDAIKAPPLLALTEEAIVSCAHRYLTAILQAGGIYRYIEARVGAGNFITEVSMDETDAPQSPEELFLILVGLAWQNVPVNTIAPRFSGRFNKGVDYVGDLAAFETEFEKHLLAVRQAKSVCDLPKDLKLSIHSGSDKYSIYPIIHRLMDKHDEGVHLKTAGTTWLEELAAFAESGAEGLALSREVYREAYAMRPELCAPYAEVIDIRPARLPLPESVDQWDGAMFAMTLRHEFTAGPMNPDFRQLLHVAYPVAARMGERYLGVLRANYGAAGRCVTRHLLEHHIRPLFIGA